ncbi:hypothetical protein ACVDHL_003150, partial [Escherichia coli]
ITRIVNEKLLDVLHSSDLVNKAQFIENYPYYRKGQTLMPHLPENNAHFVSNLIRQTQSGEFIVTSLKLPASS